MYRAEEKGEFKRFKFRRLLRVFTVVPSKSGNILEVHPQPFETFSHDISEGGLRVNNVKQLQASSVFKVDVELAKNNMAEIFGKITWIDRYECGINFLTAGQEFKKNIRQLALRTALNV